MVRVNCDYIPSWPIVYYRKRHSSTVLHLLFSTILWHSKLGNKLFAFFYFIFRIAYKSSSETQFIDILWPIIHLEYNGRGFRFGIRPLFWIIKTDSTFKMTILGIFTIFSKSNGNNLWVVLFPFIWYHYRNGRAFFTIAPFFWMRSTSSGTAFVLLPLGAFKYKSSSGWWLNIMFLIHIGVTSRAFTFFILPFIFIRNTSSRFDINLMALIHYRQKGRKKMFLLVPLFWFFYEDSGPITVVLFPVFAFESSHKHRILSIALLYWYYKNKLSNRLTTLLLPFFFYRRTNNSKFLNIALLYTYRKVVDISRHILFPFLWITIKSGKSFYFQLWPAFGFKVNQKSRGYNIYLLYPAIIFKNKHGGEHKTIYFLYPLGYYNNDGNELKSHLMPLWSYTNIQDQHLSRGFVFLYFWYSENCNSTTTKIRQLETDLKDGSYGSTPTPPPLQDDATYGVSIPTKTFSIQETTNESMYIRGIFPLFVYFRKNMDDKLLVLLPLFVCRWKVSMVDSYFLSPIYYQRYWSDTHMRRIIIPFFLHLRNPTRQLILSPLYYYWRRGSNSIRLIPPLFLSVEKGETSFMIITLPTVIYYRKTIFKFITLFPFYFRTQDATKNEIFTYYFPFFGRYSHGHKEDNTYLLFPLFRWKNNKEKQHRSLDILFPMIHYDWSPTSYSIRLLPIFWRSENERNSFLLVMPLFWRFVTDKDTRAQSNTLFLPFYFKRDSARYEFTMATPCLLPPYYIHYHREESQVEQTYLFPFFAHKIKGLDHLRWFLLILYRHQWRDFSDEMYMNILLYFRLNNSNYRISGIIPLWVQWLVKGSTTTTTPSNHSIQEESTFNSEDKEEVATTPRDESFTYGDKYHLRILLLFALDRSFQKLKKSTRYSIIWLVSNRVSLFSWKSTVKKSSNSEAIAIRRQASQIDVMDTQLPTKDEIEMETKIKNEPPLPDDHIVYSKRVYLWPLFHAKTKDDNMGKVDYFHLGLFWFIKPWLSFIYRYRSQKEMESKFYIFLVFYRFTTSLISQFAFLWLFNPNVSIFLRESSPFSTITRMFPIFWYMNGKGSRTAQAIDDSSQNKSHHILSLLYVVPRFGLYNYDNDQVSGNKSHYLMPLYHYRSGDGEKSFSLLWIIHPFLSFFNYRGGESEYRHYLFLLYYRFVTEQRSILSFIWLVHPVVAIVRSESTDNYKLFALLPVVWWKRYIDPDHHKFHISFIYLVPRFGFIDYCYDYGKPNGSEHFKRFYIMLFIFFSRDEEQVDVSFMYLIHPKATFMRGTFTENNKRLFMAPFIYYRTNEEEQIYNFALFWIADPRVAFVSYWARGLYSHFHIPLLLWVSRAEDYYQVGLFWIAWAKQSARSNPFLNQSGSSASTKHPITAIYYPVSLFLYYNDGAYRTHHLMPIYRYNWKSQNEKELLWAMLGLIYLATRQDTTEFRFAYRIIRVKHSESRFILEINPFYSYKRKGDGNTRILFLGGMCGYHDQSRGSYCRLCCFEC